MAVPRFRKTVAGTVENKGQINTFFSVGDIDGDGRPDLALCGRNGRMVWLQNPQNGSGTWKQHHVDNVSDMECGGSLVDLTGNGLLDIVNGSDAGSDKIYWWENPGDSGGTWKKRLIAETGNTQFHDTVIARNVNGRPALFFTNQRGGTTIYRIALPQEPRVEPWPGLEIVAKDKNVPKPPNPPAWHPDKRQPEEGIAAGDIDGDGIDEIVCGTHWYKLVGDTWQEHQFAPDTYISTKVAIGDIDGDGRNEIVLSEGDPLIYGKPHGGKLAWFKPGADIHALWEEHVIADFLFDPHSLQLADLCGNGRIDIFTGEIGKHENGNYIEHLPRLLIYENLGNGKFQEHVIDEGTGTHEALLVDMNGDGRLDIAGKPLWGREKYNVHVWYNEGPG